MAVRRTLLWASLAAIVAAASCRSLPLTFALQELPGVEYLSHAATWLSAGEPEDTTDEIGPDTPFEWNKKTVSAIAITSFVGLFAPAAGVGGGPFYLPIFIALLGFDTHTATALSHSCVASGALASTVYSLFQRSAVDPESPLVDFPLALTFAPALLVGTGAGVMMNTLLPEWLQTIGLVVLLSWVIFTSFRTAIKTWNRESQTKLVRTLSTKQRGQASSWDVVKEALCPPLRPETEDGEQKSVLASLEEFGVEAMTRLCHVGIYIFGMILLGIFFLGFELDMSQNSKCSWKFVFSWLSQTVFCAALCSLMLWWHVHQLRTNRGVNLDPEIRQLLTGNPFPIDEEDKVECEIVEHHGVKILLESAGLMILGGASAGLIGIGGSLIYNPFLLSLGLHPQVVASTATLLIFFSSSVVATSFYFHHVLNVSYAAHFVPPSIIFGFVGVMLVSRLVKATGRASIVIILLAVLITFGAVITGTFETFRSYTAFQEGA